MKVKVIDKNCGTYGEVIEGHINDIKDTVFSPNNHEVHYEVYHGEGKVYTIYYMEQLEVIEGWKY